MSIDLDQVISTLEWAAANDLSEATLTIDGARIRILRDRLAPDPQRSPVGLKRADTPAEVPPRTASDAVIAPLAGLCHLRPEGDAVAFAAVGATVQEGQTLCIIEAMKVMTTVTAPRAGVVEAVFVDDGQSVDAGTPLLELIR